MNSERSKHTKFDKNVHKNLLPSEGEFNNTAKHHIPSSFSSDSLSSIYTNYDRNKNYMKQNTKEKGFGLTDLRYQESDLNSKQRRLSIGGGFGENLLKDKASPYSRNYERENANNIPRSKSTNFSLNSKPYLMTENSYSRYYKDDYHEEPYGMFPRGTKSMHTHNFSLERSLQNVDYNDIDLMYQMGVEASVLASLIEPRLIDDVVLLYKSFSRSLFVANVAANASVTEITNTFENFGEVKNINYEFRKLGHFVIVNYYDLRSARDAITQLNGYSLHGQKLVIRNCVPIEPPETEQTNCFIVVRNIKREASLTLNVMKSFASFGDIKDILDINFTSPFGCVHRVIEFYDSRSVENLLQCYSSFLVQPQNSPFLEIYSQFSSKTIPLTLERPNFSIIDKLLSPFVISCKKLISHLNHQQLQERKRSGDFHQNKFYNYPLHTLRGHDEDFADENSEELRSSEEDPIPSFKKQPNFSTSSSPSSSLLPYYSSNFKSLKKEKKPVKSKTDEKPSTNNGGNTNRRKSEMVSDPTLYELRLNAVRNGEDQRTALMIKNIPNKYDQEMLLKTINKTHKQHFDFFYLPIDLKHDCNVGYAFINFISYKSIPSFVERFNGMKWKKFNSEKICEIAYARIQGKQELINHFQNSTRIKYDKKCRPVIFYSDGPNKGHEEEFPFSFEEEEEKKKPF